MARFDVRCLPGIWLNAGRRGVSAPRWVAGARALASDLRDQVCGVSESELGSLFFFAALILATFII
jgi:hypothetical protein